MIPEVRARSGYLVITTPTGVSRQRRSPGLGRDSVQPGLVRFSKDWWNDYENDCETAQRFGDDPGLELVAAGVTLRMTDPYRVSCTGLVHPRLPAPAQSELLA
jgi:hypothetical protein